MRRVRVEVCETVQKTGREILVEEQPHAGGTDTNLRSRSAAKARQARMSSRVRSGKSRRISSSLIPDARYSKTSVTVIRRPRMQGLPPRLPGSKVIRERQSMAARVEPAGRRGQSDRGGSATRQKAPPANADQPGGLGSLADLIRSGPGAPHPPGRFSMDPQNSGTP